METLETLETLEILWAFSLRIMPAMGVFVLFFWLIKPGKQLRIVLYIAGFVLLRDAMTPEGLWRLGTADGLLWIRLSSDPLFLVLFGVFSLLIVWALYAFDSENRPHLQWFRDNKTTGVVAGFIGTALVVSPFLFLYHGVDIGLRGGAVAASLLLPGLVFALLGNLLEEALFRGYVLGYLREKHSLLRAGIYSGVVFALCHVFLAVTVTDTGAPLLAFTLWEGIIAGLIGAKWGIIPAAITHGGAIFLLSSGMM